MKRDYHISVQDMLFSTPSVAVEMVTFKVFRKRVARELKTDKLVCFNFFFPIFFNLPSKNEYIPVCIILVYGTMATGQNFRGI